MKTKVRVSIPIKAKPELTEHIKRVLAVTFPQIDIIYEFSDNLLPIAISIEDRQNSLGYVETEGKQGASVPFNILIEEIHTKINKIYRELIKNEIAM